MTKTKKELEQQNAELIELLRQAQEPKPSKVQQFWTWCKPYLVPFILGMIVGGLTVTFWQSPAIPSITQTSLEQKAASGGAAIPFRSGNPLPSHSSLPPSDSNMGTVDSSLMNTYEPPLPPSLQADNGQIPSTRFYRLLLRRTR